MAEKAEQEAEKFGGMKVGEYMVHVNTHILKS